MVVWGLWFFILFFEYWKVVMCVEVIYKGVMCLVMKFGILFKLLVVLVGSSMLLMMWVGVFVSWWIGFVVVMVVLFVLFVMWLIIVRDD